MKGFRAMTGKIKEQGRCGVHCPCSFISVCRCCVQRTQSVYSAYGLSIENGGGLLIVRRGLLHQCSGGMISCSASSRDFSKGNLQPRLPSG